MRQSFFLARRLPVNLISSQMIRLESPMSADWSLLSSARAAAGIRETTKAVAIIFFIKLILL